MPVFPEGNYQTRLSPSSPVEISSTRDARMNGEQIQQLAQGIGKVGEAITEAEVISTEAKAAQAAERARNRAIGEANKDGSNIPALTDKYTKEEMVPIRQNSDPLVNARMDGHYQKIAATNNVFAMGEQLRYANKHLINTYSSAADESAKRVQSNPELAPLELQTFRTNMDNQVKKGILSEATANGIFEVNADKMARARVDGLISQKKFGQVALELGGTEQDLTMEMTPDQLGAYGLKADGTQKLGYKLKNGETMDPTMTEVYRQLKPEVRERFLDKIRAERQRDAHVGLSTNTATIRAVSAMHARGDDVSPKNESQAMSAIQGLPEEYRAGALEEYAAVKKISPVMYAAKTGTQEQAQQKFQEFVTSLGESNDPVVKEKITKMISKARDGVMGIWQDKRKDINQTNIDNNADLAKKYAASKSGKPEDIQSYLQAADALANASGVAPRLTTNQQAEQLNMQGRGALQDPDTAVNWFDTLEKQYGNKLPRLMAELHEKDKSAIDPSLIIAANMSDVGSKRAVFSNMKNKPVIEEAFKKRYEAADLKNFNASLNNKMDEFQLSISDSSSGLGDVKVTSAFRDQVEINAKRIMVGASKISPSEAVEQSYTQLVDANFNSVRTSASRLIVPKQYNVEAIKGFFNENDPRKSSGSGREKFLGAQNSSLVSRFNIGVGSANVPKGVDETTANLRYVEKVTNSGKWVTNSTQTGANLVYSKDGILVPVLNKLNKPVTVDYNELGNYFSKVGK